MKELSSTPAFSHRCKAKEQAVDEVEKEEEEEEKKEMRKKKKSLSLMQRKHVKQWQNTELCLKRRMGSGDKELVHECKTACGGSFWF